MNWFGRLFDRPWSGRSNDASQTTESLRTAEQDVVLSMTLNQAEQLVRDYSSILGEESPPDEPAGCISRLPDSKQRIIQAMKLWLAYAIQKRRLSDELQNMIGTVAGSLPYYVSDAEARRINDMKRRFKPAGRAPLSAKEFMAHREEITILEKWDIDAMSAGLALRCELSAFVTTVQEYRPDDQLYWQRVYTLVGLRVPDTRSL